MQQVCVKYLSVLVCHDQGKGCLAMKFAVTFSIGVSSLYLAACPSWPK